MKTTFKAENRFERDASRYAAYLDSPEGRLRLDLALANLQEFLPALQANNSLSALDLGCGIGEPMCPEPGEPANITVYAEGV